MSKKKTYSKGFSLLENFNFPKVENLLTINILQTATPQYLASFFIPCLLFSVSYVDLSSLYRRISNFFAATQFNFYIRSSFL